MKDAFIKAFGCYKDNDRQTLAVYHGVIKALERLEKLEKQHKDLLRKYTYLLREKKDDIR
jgi:hypothetical protein